MHRTRARSIRPMVAHRQRGAQHQSAAFSAPEIWYEPQNQSAIRYVTQQAGAGYVHPVTMDEVRQRIAELPQRFTHSI